jgi:hypothetical protein
MTIKTQRRIVSFTSPFTLRAVDGLQPPGDYIVDVDEELIDGLSRLAYRKVATLLHLPCVSKQRCDSQVITVDPVEFEAALLKDQEVQVAATKLIPLA